MTWPIWGHYFDISSLRWVCMCVYVWLLSDMCWFQSAGRFYLQTRLTCGKTKWKKGFAIKLPGIIYCALCDVPAKQIWWHWFDREKSDREKRGIGVSEGWRVDGRSIFCPFFWVSFFLYPLRHFVIVYSVLRSKKVNILDWLQLSGWVICCMCGFSEI